MPSPATKVGLSVELLRCEYRDNPVGLDILHPRLSWVIKSEARSEKQSSYQILVASTPELLGHDTGDLWDTGQVQSDRQNQVEFAGLPLAARMSCHWKVRIWNDRGALSAWSCPAHFAMGLLAPEDWQAQWIGMDEPLTAKPGKSSHLDPRDDTVPRLVATPRYLRKEFAVIRKVRRAIIYITALGLYELRLNGQRVGDHLLAPEWTNYHRRVQYQAYDVTPLLREGINALGAVVGNGWYSGLLQNWPCNVRNYGDAPLLLAQLEMDGEDGARQIVATDSSWCGSLDGPLRFSGIYEGETYDARKEMPGWDDADFSNEGWSPVQIVAAPQAGKLVGQRNDPIRVSHELKPVAVTEPSPGVYVFAFAQNMVGWARWTGQGKAGDLIEFQYGEMLNLDGSVFTGNLRVVCQKHEMQLDRYLVRGAKEETFEPHFTYHGFQYVEVRGLRGQPSLESLVGVVFHSDCRETGTFACSDPMVNRLAENILWSQRGNFMGVPTDCPQRDERCGYTGDAQFFIRAAVYNMDVAAFFNKWLVDVCEDSQLPGGWFADHAPHYAAAGAGPNTGWSDAGIICPYEIFRTYGDTRVIREHYPAMKRKMAWLAGQTRDHLFVGKVGNGDWLNRGGGVSNEVLGTAYAAFDFQLMAEMAEAIRETADATHYSRQARAIGEAFAQAYLDAEGRIKDESQSAYALAFTMGLVPGDLQQQMSERFVEELQRFDWHPATGFIGTPRLLPGLHLAGRDDAAYRLLLTQTPPSWLYPVSLGATTIWEHWDSYDGRNPQGGMNSLNHYAFGSVGEYLFRHIAGIQNITPGYQQIRIEPIIRQGLTWARATYQSICGEIRSAWRIRDDRLEMEIAIPPNTSATVFIPVKHPDSICESNRPAASAEGVTYLRTEGESTVFEIGSGQYHFTAKWE